MISLLKTVRPGIGTLMMQTYNRTGAKAANTDIPEEDLVHAFQGTGIGLKDLKEELYALMMVKTVGTAQPRVKGTSPTD